MVKKTPTQIRFFATRSDLLPVLQAVEEQKDIKYVLFDWSEREEPVSYSKATELPDLGKASAESSVVSTTFLMCPRGEIIKARQVGESVYAFDQLVNPNTITFTPGGLWDKDVLISGRFASASEVSFSVELLRLLGSLVRKRFKKIKAFYVGEEAEQMLDRGKRLTMATQSPRTFDLSRN